MHKILFVYTALFLYFPAFTQVYKDRKAAVEDRVNNLLDQMTTEEKIDYIGGVDGFYIRAMERLGLPKIKMSDGPVGVRTYGPATAYPAGILAAATWDTALLTQMGTALGKDARARGVHILLAPGVNIFRASMCGRNFEYLGEDPYLAARMAVNYIRGVQAQGVVATVKHYAANNQEWDRHHVSSDMAERTLQEIYLPAFKAAVTEAGVGAVMNSYNLVNGIHATQNGHLNIDILKNSWGFNGILMSDWESTYDGTAAAQNGLDLEMPSAKFMNREALLPALASGALTEAALNDKVKRILRIIFRFGFYDTDQLDKSVPANNPVNDQVALAIARSGMVLLKNENRLLPLSAGKIKRIAVIGPNADAYVTGGGSSYTTPFHFTSVLKGLQNMAGDKTQLVYAPGFRNLEGSARQSVFYGPDAAVKGMQAEYFANKELNGPPVATRTEAFVDHQWKEAPDVAGIAADNFSIRWTGVIKPLVSASYRFAVKGDDGFRLWVNEKKVIDDWHDHAATTGNADMLLEAGKEYRIRLEYYENGGDADIAFAWYPATLDFSEAVTAAKNADVAIVCVGFNESQEHEGGDRSFELPSFQDSLINAIAKVNRHTVVVLNAGGNVNMQRWLKNVSGLLHAWYPGQEGGTAVAEILFGKVNPSGKLPVSFEKEWKDNPVFENYYDADNDKHVAYKEGLFVGYRYWDTAATKPQYPFGFGLSYTDFSYGNFQIRNTGTPGAPALTVRFSVTNTGNYDGAETAQLYVRQQKSSAIRPFKELKGFVKLSLKKGETKTATIPLDAGAFSYYKDGQGFGYDPGSFDIMVGASSAEIRWKKAVTVR
jgi:beta-glucosidase